MPSYEVCGTLQGFLRISMTDQKSQKSARDAVRSLPKRVVLLDRHTGKPVAEAMLEVADVQVEEIRIVADDTVDPYRQLPDE